ncbi:hypothetical protein UA75_31105 (plasmid) [Actinoalloteichus sp. GBA129-24]|nr:hypothetical protein UA75_14625 [Actinoalloteichus sp. GBA129-24]APU24184.1 hypothetical protein UA75_31105 [Actinoalloteichus sp. GBA129-24]
MRIVCSHTEVELDVTTAAPDDTATAIFEWTTSRDGRRYATVTTWCCVAHTGRSWDLFSLDCPPWLQRLAAEHQPARSTS